MSLSDHIPGRVYTRSDWGAPATPGGAYRSLSQVSRTVFHWTTGDTLGASNQARWVKNIYDYHTGHNGWADIGYNYLVDRYGSVYVGRGRYRVGAHAPGANSDGMGIALLGGSSAALTSEAKQAINGLMTWLAESVTTGDERGHGEVPGNNTSCPGQAVRQWVADGRPGPDGSEGDPDEGQPGDTAPDLVVAVAASTLADEGMARVLGKSYQWRYLSVGHDAPHADRIDGLHVGTLVRVGAAAQVDPRSVATVDEFYDVAGESRDATAAAVADRIAADTGDSRSVT